MMAVTFAYFRSQLVFFLNSILTCPYINALHILLRYETFSEGLLLFGNTSVLSRGTARISPISVVGPQRDGECHVNGDLSFNMTAVVSPSAVFANRR